jgi:hypothetical protein
MMMSGRKLYSVLLIAAFAAEILASIGAASAAMSDDVLDYAKNPSGPSNDGVALID